MKYLIFLLLTTTIFAYQEIDSIKVLLEELPKQERMERSAQICWENRSKNTELAIYAGKIAISIAEEIGDKQKLAVFHNYIGVAYLNDDFLSTALHSFKDALDFADEVNDSLQMGYALNNMGTVFRIRDNFVLAIDFIEDSRSIFENIKDTRGAAYCILNLAICYQNLGRFDEAFRALDIAEDYRIKDGNELGVAVIKYNRAEVYVTKGEYDKALSILESALPVYFKFEDYRSAGILMEEIGNIYYIIGKYDKSVDIRTESLKLNLDINYRDGIINNRIGLALNYSKLGKKEIGLIQLDKALAVAKEINSKSQIRNIYKAYGEFYNNINDKTNAIKSYEKYIEVNEKFLIEESRELFNELHEKYDREKQYITLSNKLKSENANKIYTYSIISLLLVIAIILFWKYFTHNKLNKKLNEVNVTKDKFFRIIAHDLKAPFNSLLGYANILYDDFDSFSEKEKLESIGEIKSSGEKVFNLLENLLYWSTLQTGEFRIAKKEINICELIKKNIDLYKATAKSKNINLKTDLISECTVYSDEFILNTTLRNLINNSLKFTNPNGQITVSTNVSDNLFFITVTDTGIGMTKNKISEIFNLSSNSSTIGLMGEHGTGLGLTLCNELISRINGELSIISEEGNGTVITITINKS